MDDPLAPIESTHTGGEPCPRCGNQMDPSRAQYDDNGALVCAFCAGSAASAAATDRITQTNERERKDLFPGAIGALMVAILSFCVEHRFFFFLMPTIAFFYATVTLHQLRTQPDLRRAIGWRFIPSVILSVLACLVAISSLLASIFIRLE